MKANALFGIFSIWIVIIKVCFSLEQETLALDDLLAVIPTSIDRLSLSKAGRQWRKGLKAYLVADQKLPYKEKEKAEFFAERWGVYADIDEAKLLHGPRRGDLRAALAPFLANKTVGTDNYKWILYGDDDTVFFVENVLQMLKGLDYRQPYLLSDCLWWPKGGSGVKLHPNREAPRCLPCNYKDPALMAGDMCPGMQGFMPVQGCPCTPQQIMEGHWKGGQPRFPDGRGIFDREEGTFITRPDNPDSPDIGWWYMLHGGAGAIISRGAMQRASFEVVHQYLSALEPQSGDAMLTKAFWNVLQLGPTDPGYGLCRPHIQMFDAGFRQPRARGPEDSGTLDGGADPVGVMQRLEKSLTKEGCDANCEDQLAHMLSVHVRSRYAEEDMKAAESSDTKSLILEQPKRAKFSSAAFLMRKLAHLHKNHALRRRGRSGFISLWND